ASSSSRSGSHRGAPREEVGAVAAGSAIAATSTARSPVSVEVAPSAAKERRNPGSQVAARAGGFIMEPRRGEQKTEGCPEPKPTRFRILKLEERIAPIKGGTNGNHNTCRTCLHCAN